MTIKNSQPWQRFFLGAAILASVALWGIVLPRLAQQPAMREKIENLHNRGIDAGAFFYSDHPSAFSDQARKKEDR